MTFDYQLAYGNSDIDTRYASALYISAVSVTGSAQNPQFGEPISAIGVYSDMLTALAGYTEKIEVGTNEETEVYILPGKNNIRYFTPTYDGPYTFTGDDAYARRVSRRRTARGRRRRACRAAERPCWQTYG